MRRPRSLVLFTVLGALLALGPPAAMLAPAVLAAEPRRTSLRALTPASSEHVAFSGAASRAAADTAGDTAAVRRGSDRTAGSVVGQIIDAATGEALAGALVVLVVQPDGVFAPAGAGASAFPVAARQAQSDARGRYRFGALAPGAYRLRASRLGYTPATADVTIVDAAPEVSFGLAVAPLALRPVQVRGTRTAVAQLLAGPRAGAADGDTVARRLGAVAERQRAYLTTDAHELTRADVGETATLAESDLFRAVQRLPGVSTRDETTAELWTRGARADLTRVTFDGLPLFGPVAAFGTFAAVNSDAVGSATLLPGVRPASIGEGGAAVLDLRTRAGGRTGGRLTSGVAGVGEVGIASARLALDGSTRDGGAAWRVTGRRSYVDAIGRLVGALGAGNSVQFPSFGDLSARGDVRLSPTQTVAATALVQETASPASAAWVPPGSRQGAAWGNRLLRLTHSAVFGGLRVTHTVGGSAFAFGGRGPTPAPTILAGVTDDSTIQRILSNTVPQSAVRASALVLRGEVAPIGTAPGGASGGASGASPEPAWAAGYELARQRTRYRGLTQYFRGDFDGVDPLARDSAVTLDGAVTVGALWAMRRYEPAARLTVEPGLRLELAGGAGAPATLHPAPRLAARYTLDADTRLSAALGRSVQYTQALPPIGISNAARLYPGALWLTAGRDAPPLVTDLATVGVERWLGAGWLASANAYTRRTRGYATADPAPELAADRALYVVGREAGRGLELSARRLVGHTTATVAYSWSASTVAAGPWRYAAREDRPHVFDATVSERLGARWRVGAAFSAATGTPYTRTVDREFVADPATALDAYGAIGGGFVRDVPNARRNPGFFGADLIAEYTRPVGAWHLGAFAQLHSPLAAVTSDAYESGEMCFVRAGSAPTAVFAPGAHCTVSSSPRATTYPVIPAVGMRFAF